MGRTVANVKLAGETYSQVFNFLSRLAIGETISSASTVSTVYSGTDASPSAFLAGSPSISGAEVTQVLTAGTLGVTYQVVVSAVTSASQTLQQTALVTVVPDSI